MKFWHLPTIGPSTRKETKRDPGADAPRVARVGRQMPRVLFSSPECRAVVIDLQGGHEIGDHHVRERALVQVVSGTVTIESSGSTVECPAGTLVTFDPGERHAVRALTTAQLLLVLAPWTATEHYAEGEVAPGEHLPSNALIEPDQTIEAAGE